MMLQSPPSTNGKRPPVVQDATRSANARLYSATSGSLRTPVDGRVKSLYGAGVTSPRSSAASRWTMPSSRKTAGARSTCRASFSPS